MGRSLSDAVRKISTTSMPAMHTHAGPSAFTAVSDQGSDSDLSQKGSNSSLEPATACVTTAPQVPLSPVFSTVTAEPLQPQPLTAGANRRPSSDVPASPPYKATPPSLIEHGFTGDKYAALADLDSAFHDPRKIPVTSIDWCASQSAQEDCEQTSGTDRQTETHHQHPVTIPTTHSPTKDSPLSHPSTSPTSRNDVIHNDVTGDKYAALADLNSDAALTTAVDWGTSQSTEQDPEATSEGGVQGDEVVRRGSSLEDLGGKAHRTRSGSATASVPGRNTVNAIRVISTSPPSGSKMAPQAQLYGTPPQSLVYGGRLTAASSLQYFAPAHMYNPPPSPQRAGFPPSQVSNAAGYGYTQSSAHHGNQFPSTSVGFSWVPAYLGGVPQGFQGAGWGQGGGLIPSPSSLSSPSSTPFAVAGQLPCQASLCLSS